jgi:hypothetical protein
LIIILEVSLTYHEPEQLRCVFCYPIVALIRLKKGIINYKSTNRIVEFQKHLEMIHKKIRIKRIEQEKLTRFEDRKSTKKKSSPASSNIASFFGCFVPYSKNDPHQIQFEEHLVFSLLRN